MKLKDRIIAILSKAGKPLSFEKIYEMLESDGHTMPSDKPKLKVRQMLYSTESFEVEKGGLFKLTEGVQPEPAQTQEGGKNENKPVAGKLSEPAKTAVKHVEEPVKKVLTTSSPVVESGKKEPEKQERNAEAAAGTFAARKIQDRIIAVLSKAGKPLSFEKIYEMLESDGHPMPADKPKLKVRQMLYNRESFDVEKGGLFKLREGGAQPIQAQTPAVEPRKEAISAGGSAVKDTPPAQAPEQKAVSGTVQMEQGMAAKPDDRSTDFLADIRRRAEEEAAQIREEARRHAVEIAARAREEARKHLEEATRIAAREAAEAARLAAAEVARQIAEEQTKMAAERDAARKAAVEAAIATAKDAAKSVLLEQQREMEAVRLKMTEDIETAAAAKAAEATRSLTTQSSFAETEPASQPAPGPVPGGTIPQSSGHQSIRQRAANAIKNAGRPLDSREVFRALQQDEYPLPARNPEEVIERVLKNPAIFAEVEPGFYAPIAD